MWLLAVLVGVVETWGLCACVIGFGWLLLVVYFDWFGLCTV